MKPILILIIAQLLFSFSDLIGRYYIIRVGFRFSSFLSLWFFSYIFLKLLAIFGQLYAFANFKLGKTMALFAVVSIVFSNILGFLILKEVLTAKEYIGITLAIITFFILAFAK